jgi:anti-sigma factor RsiW
MNPCDRHNEDILRFLDNELSGRDLEDFSTHLKNCASCQARLEAEQALSRLLRQSGPLYTPPAHLRARVSALLDQHPMPPATAEPLVARFGHILERFRLQIPQWAPRWRMLVSAALAIAICLALIPRVTRQVRAADYVETAVSTHRGYLNGNLPLEIQSDSPGAVTSWLARRLSFPFQLPDSQVDSAGKPVFYRLTGARLVNYNGSQAALIAYVDVRNGKISLLVDSSKSAVVAGGEEVHFGNLTFHYRSESGFKVITWNNHGLSYALISAISGSAQGSCLVCHQDMKDRDSFQAVNRSRWNNAR